ncbi:rod shape-determining protein RodA [Allosphingosinicella flava]|uniref:Peptidoglycan glycosyltransferase MrdB n=1 Tax=Allosphingosinicella flava TaxID=2771430 RepID=A0A7T2LMD8_9SPHN|nr:rod shape-determining protein RodA [Sphingosinicella flava]QPQ55436.1 rod shape-determining protein RodA [Sphingosinicella flava]
MSFIPAAVARLSWPAIILAAVIALFGGVVLYSVGGGSPSPWALSHVIRFSLFLTMAIGISFISPKRMKPFVFVAYGGVLFLLILVQALGFIGGGARSWLNLGFIVLQPSELMKPVIVLVLARFYDLLPAGQIRSWSAIWPAGLLIGIPFLMIAAQPDLGTASLVVFSGLTIMFLAGVPLRLFVGGIAAIAMVVPIAYNFLLLPHQQRRLTIFLDPELDPLGAGYHISQSQIAIGSGGIFGKGYLNGTQSHLKYLPEVHTDFIFPAMVEEWGLVGALFLILCFFLLLRWGMKVALDTKPRFDRLVAAGLTTTIFFYIAINLMMVMGLAPVVGIPLPLFSHGGSAMLTVMISLGILMSIDRNNRLKRKGLV